MHPVFPPSSPIAIVQDELPVADTSVTGTSREPGNTDSFVRLTKLEFESSSSESGNEYPEEAEEKIYGGEGEGYVTPGITFPNSSLLQKHEYQRRQQHQQITTQDIYPTPVPSSSTGRTSSPVKLSSPLAFETQPGRTEENKPYFNDLDSDSFNNVPLKQERKFETPWTPLKNYTVCPKVLQLSIEPNNTQRIIIGRHREICDFQLPPYKTISRKHASISYIPQRNQIRLECYGSNGIYVTLPRNLNCVLVKPVYDMPVFELTGEHTARLLEKLHGYEHRHRQQKSVFRDLKSTSFGLEKGESVLMPFINGTLLDFRQARVAIGMNQSSYPRTNDFGDDSYSDSDSDIESGHSFIEYDTDGEHMVDYYSDIPSESNTSTNTRKRKKSSKGNIYINPRWKRPLRSKVVKMATPEASPDESADSSIDNKVSTSCSVSEHSAKGQVSTSKLKPKLAPESESESKPKQKPKLKSKSRRTPDEILASLRDKNINVKEVQHVLANHLAFGNSLQVPLSQLRTVSSQIRTLQKDELRYILGNVRCIGIIYRQGKDAAGKPLEEEYFYDMEKDDDLQRKNLVSVTKGGRSELRSCRRTHKQYFWKKPT